MSAHLRLQQFWASSVSGIATRRSSEEAITTLERKYAITLPEDFRNYLLLCCPNNSEEMDAQGTRWWSLDRIKNVPEELGSANLDGLPSGLPQHLFFADYLVWSVAWAINCGDEEDRGAIILIGDGERVAASFSEFIDRYVRDEDSIYGASSASRSAATNLNGCAIVLAGLALIALVVLLALNLAD